MELKFGSDVIKPGETEVLLAKNFPSIPVVELVLQVMISMILESIPFVHMSVVHTLFVSKMREGAMFAGELCSHGSKILKKNQYVPCSVKLHDIDNLVAGECDSFLLLERTAVFSISDAG